MADAAEYSPISSGSEDYRGHVHDGPGNAGEPPTENQGDWRRNIEVALNALFSCQGDDHICARTLARATEQSLEPTRRWLAHVLVCQSETLAECIIRRYESRARHSGGRATDGFAIVWHPTEQETENHLHIYHACSFKDSYCRCSHLRGLRFQRGLGRRILYCHDLDEKYWANWLQYFSSTPRRIVFLEVGQISTRLHEVRRHQDLREHEGVPSDGSDGAMANCELQVQTRTQQVWRSLKRRNEQDLETTSRASSETGDPVPRSNYEPGPKIKKKVEAHRRLVQAIKQFLCVPIPSTCEIQPWLEDPYLCYFDKRDLDYQRAVSQVARESCLYTLPQIIKLIADTEVAVWYARTPGHYLDTDIGQQALEDLLMLQYGSAHEITAFLGRLIDITEKRLPKKNTMYVQGPPNCGKTWFFDCVCALYLNVGHVANMVRGEHFPLNDCVQRRLIMWNEPSIMPSAYDTIKMLCGGDPCPANVKYQGHSVISRTPVIFTANADVLPRTEVWNTRVYREKWRPAPFLRPIGGYPSPISLIMLLNKYQLLYLTLFTYGRTWDLGFSCTLLGSRKRRV